MKFLLLIGVSLICVLTNQNVFAETEMIGHIKITDIYSTEPIPQSYIFWFQEVDQTTPYRLNPHTLPSDILDFAGDKVRITVSDDKAIPLASSIDPTLQSLDVITIEKIQIPDGVSALVVPSSARSVTLLSKFSDVSTIPSEDPIQFRMPQGVAIDSSDNIYVADSYTMGFDHVIQKFNSNGVFLEKFGSLCQLSTTTGCSDPDGGGPLESGDGQFLFPSDVAIDSAGNIIVADNNNHRIQKLDPNGSFLFKLGASGGDGTLGNGDGEFWFPFGVAVDSTNNIYVADTTNSRIEKFDSSGNFQGWMGFCNSGSNCDLVNSRSFGFSCTSSTCSSPVGSTGNGHFSGPRGIAIDSSDKIYVADTGNNRIQIFNSSGNFISKFGTSGSSDGQFNLPRGIAADDSKIYVADTNNNRVQIFDSTGTFQLKFGTLGTSDGQFNSTQGIEVDSSGNIFVGDTNNLRIQKFNSTGGFISKIDTSPGLLHDVSYYQDLFYDGAASVKQYYNVSSYGKFLWNGTAHGWKSLPSTQATYQNQLNLMLSDAIAAHDSDIDFCNPTPVTNLILIFNGPVIGATNAALGSVGTWEENKSFENGGCTSSISVSWEPDNGGFFCCGQTLDRGIGVTAHELGHNLGFEHTPPPPGAWVGGNTDPYHDPNSVMSSNRDQESPSALITGQRDEAGWMTLGNKQTVSDGTSATIALDYINESDVGVNPQMIIIPLANGSSYIIEAHKDELFNDTPQDRTGAIMYIHLPGGNNYSYLSLPADKAAEYSLVATAGTETESKFDEAILELNETYEDITNNVTVTTQSIDATSITVFVSNNAGTCTPPSGFDWIITESCTISQNVTADKNIIVQNNAVLTIPNGLTVFFDPATFNITIEFGSGVLIEQGGSIKTSP